MLSFTLRLFVLSPIFVSKLVSPTASVLLPHHPNVSHRVSLCPLPGVFKTPSTYLPDFLPSHCRWCCLYPCCGLRIIWNSFLPLICCGVCFTCDPSFYISLPSVHAWHKVTKLFKIKPEDTVADGFFFLNLAALLNFLWSNLCPVYKQQMV